MRDGLQASRSVTDGIEFLGVSCFEVGNMDHEFAKKCLEVEGLLQL